MLHMGIAACTLAEMLVAENRLSEQMDACSFLIKLPGLKTALGNIPVKHSAALALALPKTTAQLATDMSAVLHRGVRMLTQHAESPGQYTSQLALLTALQVWSSCSDTVPQSVQIHT